MPERLMGCAQAAILFIAKKSVSLNAVYKLTPPLTRRLFAELKIGF